MTKQPQDQYQVRFPDGLRDRVKAAAVENNRSMNAEIVATLEEKYPTESANEFLKAFVDYFQRNARTSPPPMSDLEYNGNEIKITWGQNGTKTISFSDDFFPDHARNKVRKFIRDKGDSHSRK